MKPLTRVYFYEDEQRFFGEGPCRLLRGIETHGSLRAAAQSMELSYSKAITMLNRAEEKLGFALTEKSIGGKGGGGSRLTAEAKAFLLKYEQYRDRCYAENQRLFDEFFPELSEKRKKIGCVIMASGQGKRFGSNKLLAEFQGKTLIERVLNLTEGLFDRRVVVTRTAEVAQLCEEKAVPVIFHDLPDRSDTVRLGVEQMSEMDGCVFCPCDQPLLQRSSLEKMLKAFEKGEKSIIRLGCGEQVGAPVLFDKRYFEQLKQLPQHNGGSYVMKQFPTEILISSASSEWELFDMDTTENMEELLKAAENFPEFCQSQQN